MAKNSFMHVDKVDDNPAESLSQNGITNITLIKLILMTQQADKQNLYNIVETLSVSPIPRKYQNIKRLNEVAGFITGKFKSYGYETQFQTWKIDGVEYKNVIAKFNPEKKRRLIVGGHYDVCGDTPGADDNASAVAGLLETARITSANKPKLDYGIDFVAYSLEEPPFFGTDNMGSFIHAKSLHDSKTNVLGMLCYEMIGYFSETQEYPNELLRAMYPTHGNYIAVIGLEKYNSFSNQFYNNMKSGSKIQTEKVLFPVYNDLAALSDHVNYWHFNYPAVMINDTSFLRNHNYHLPSDTIDTLNFDMMASVVDAVYNGMVKF